MNVRFLTYALTCSLLVLTSPSSHAQAQSFASQIQIGYERLGCQASDGRTVGISLDDGIYSNIGMAYFDDRTGEPRIRISPRWLSEVPYKAAIFWFYHECAHLNLPIGVGTQSRAAEVNADCWAINRMYNHGHIRRPSDLGQIASDVSRLPGSDMHLPGPWRVARMMECAVPGVEIGPGIGSSGLNVPPRLAASEYPSDFAEADYVVISDQPVTTSDASLELNPPYRLDRSIDYHRFEGPQSSVRGDPNGPRSTRDMQVSPDGQLVAIAHSTGNVVVYRLPLDDAQSEFWQKLSPDVPVVSLTWSDVMYYGDSTPTMALTWIDAEGGMSRSQAEAGASATYGGITPGTLGSISAAALDPTDPGRIVLSAARAGGSFVAGVVRRGATEADFLLQDRSDDAYDRLGFSSDGRFIAGLSGGDLFVWYAEAREQLEAGSLQSMTRRAAGVSAFAFSRYSTRVAYGTRDGELVVSPLNPSTDRISLRASQCATTSLDFSVDGTRLLMGCEDGSVRVIDLGTQELIDRFFAHDGILLGAQFSADGSIITYGVDGRLRRWVED